MSNKTIYFGYGSNFWLEQMKRRCPESKLIGIGFLENWKWIVNVRGFANIIPSAGDIVYGFVFELTARDLHYLNIYEGSQYARKTILVEIISKEDLQPSKYTVESLVFVDVERKSECQPRKEYVNRMNMAIVDALREGVPSEYVDKYLRAFIPPPDTMPT